MTGLPCPLCGSTRSLRAWARLDPVAAWRFNPLTSTSGAAILLWALLSTLERALARGWTPALRGVLSHLPIGWLLLALVLLNWMYLCRTLPG